MATDIVDTPAPESAPERIVLAPRMAYALPEGALLLVRERTGARSRVTRRVAVLLAQCSTMRTLDEHARALAAGLPHVVDGPAEAQGLIQSAREEGLFISSTDIEDALGAAPRLSPDDPPGVVCVVTRDRPATLRRALDSVSTGDPTAGTHAGWVLDDSRDATNSERNRALTLEVAARRHRPLRYFGLREQRAVVAHLCRVLPEHVASVEFLFGRQEDEGIVSHGRVLNFALLLSAGANLVQVDDDIVCRGCPPPMGVSRTMRWGRMVRKAAFFASDDERDEHCAATGMNPAATMSRFVGERLPTVAAELRRREGLDLHFEGMTATDAEALCGGEARVAAATCGLYGDPGTASPSWMFEHQGDDLRRLAGERGRYGAALRQRNAWLGTDGYRLTRRHGLLSPLRVLDHRALLPPYFPLFRGEDYLLGRLIPLVHRSAWFLEFPWAVPHLPEPTRRWPPDLLDRPETLSFAVFTATLWKHDLRPPRSADVGQRLERLGEQVRAMGEADAHAVADAMSDCLRTVRSDFIRVMERRLQDGEEAPPWYRRDLLRLIEVNRRALDAPAEPSLSDMREAGSHAVPRVLELWRAYGAALQAWPEILAAVGDLSDPRPG